MVRPNSVTRDQQIVILVFTSNERRTEYPAFLILIVSNIPVYRNCLNTKSLSNSLGACNIYNITKQLEYTRWRSYLVIIRFDAADKIWMCLLQSLH